MSVYQRPGSRFWWFRFQLDGRTIARSSGQTTRRAALSAESAAKSVELAKAPRSSSARGLGLLTTLAAEDVEILSGGGASAGYVSGVEWCWRNVLEFFAGASASELSEGRLREYVEWRRRLNGKGESIKRELAMLKRVARRAKSRGWLLAMPEKWPKAPKTPPDARRAGKLRDAETLNKFFAILTNEDARDVHRFAALTGLRWGELLKLEASWMHATPGGPVLRIPASGAKTRRERVVTLSAPAVEIVRRRAEARAGLTIFPRRIYNMSAKLACRKLGISPTITLRDLRHYYATTGLGATGDTTALIHQTGHSRDVMEVYQHSTITRLAAVSDAVAKSLEVGTPPLGTAAATDGESSGIPTVPTVPRADANVGIPRTCCASCRAAWRKLAGCCGTGRTGESVHAPRKAVA